METINGVDEIDWIHLIVVVPKCPTNKYPLTKDQGRPTQREGFVQITSLHWSSDKCCKTFFVVNDTLQAIKD
jgi:hypothetical protein